MDSVCGPIGGFTQHVRWLLLMSSNYNSLEKLNYTSALVYGKRFPLKPADKVKFIKEFIYPEERKCFNWLDEKYMYREQLDKTLLHTHDLEKVKNNPTVLIVMDPLFSYNFYLKFVPGIGWDKEDFIKQVDKQNKEILEFNKHYPNTIVIDTEKLYSPTLDRKTYEDMINFLSIENVYEHAQAIHEMWYNLRKGSEEEIINYALNSKFPDYPWTYKVGCPITEHEHEILRNNLLEVYYKQ